MSISYLPLDDSHLARTFRLLHILRGEEGSTLSCRLRHFSIHRAPPYRAISYTWGDPFATGERNDETELEEVLVDGSSVYVSKSVTSVLKAMRDWHTAHSDWIWADAICIDQSNVRERGQQVVLMSQIYSQADSIVVWLGPATEDSDVALGLLRDLADDRRKDDPRTAILQRVADTKGIARWLALAGLMNRRWWTRAWVLQECVLARLLDYACGKTLIPGGDVLDGFDAIEDHRDKVYDMLSDIHGVSLNVHSGNVINGMSRMRAARLAGTVYSMQTCHFRSMSAQATAPRDYVYAKLGLASDGHFVHPDYAKGVMETYRDFVADHIRATRSLDIIYFDARPRETPNLPSWVPDWNASFGAEHLVTEEKISIGHGVQLVQTEILENRNKDAVATFDFKADDSHRLVVSCCFFDIVDGVSKAGEVGWQGTEAPRPMSQTKFPKSAYGDDEATFNAVWRTLVANKGFEDQPLLPATGGILAAVLNPENLKQPKSGPRFTNYWENVRGFRVGDKTVEEWMRWGREYLPTSQFTLEEQIEVERSFVDVSYFRRFLTTSRGYTGIASCETEVGDQVCVLKGIKLPVILRRADGTRGGDPLDYSLGDWILVGHGYVHQIMEAPQSKPFVTAGIV